VVGVEQWAEVRRMYQVDGLSAREISRRTALARDTVARSPVIRWPIRDSPDRPKRRRAYEHERRAGDDLRRQNEEADLGAAGDDGAVKRLIGRPRQSTVPPGPRPDPSFTAGIDASSFVDRLEVQERWNRGDQRRDLLGWKLVDQAGELVLG
jgi:hypothetical protein